MKLLFIGYLHGFGGAEKMLINLANAMAKRQHQVTLLGMAEDNPCYPISDKVQYVFCPDKGSNHISRILTRFQILRNIIQEVGPDLVIHFNLQSVYLSAFMGKKISQKTIYCERGDPYDKEYKGVLGLLRKISFKRIKGFVFQTTGARDFFDNSIRERSCIIRNPVFINPDDYPQLNTREKRIVTVGRLSEQKNQKMLIEAVAKLPKCLWNYRIEIHGDGPLREQLEQMIQDLDLKERVFLMGAVPDINNRIKDAALFVLSSDYEGMPNALLEALAIGLPSISTDCRPGGARELIEDGVSGCIVPCGDVNALASAMERMLLNSKMATSFGKAGQRVAQASHPETIYSAWEQFFLANINRDSAV